MKSIKGISFLLLVQFILIFPVNGQEETKTENTSEKEEEKKPPLSESLRDKSNTIKSEASKLIDSLDIHGFVDVYYQDNNNQSSGTQTDTSRGFETYNLQFTVNLIKLEIQKLADKKDPWGFRLDFMNGTNTIYQEAPRSQTNSINNMNAFQQAYVSFYLDYHRGFTVDVGKMATHMGYEKIESKNNPNYTIGAIFFNTTSFLHTGARIKGKITDDWDVSFFLYNSGLGSGYQNASFLTSTNPASNPTNTNIFIDGFRQQKAYGTQIKGDLIKDRLVFTYNTLFSSDNPFARQNPSQQYVGQTISSQTGVQNSAPIQSRGKFFQDMWNTNEIILSLTLTDKWALDFDWVHGEKGGSVSTNTSLSQQEYNPNGIINQSTLLLGQTTPIHIKSIYNAYGLWSKYKINEKLELNGRFEYIDDKNNNGALISGPGVAGNPAEKQYEKDFYSNLADLILQSLNLNPNALAYGPYNPLTLHTVMVERIDKNQRDYSGFRNYGQYHTLTLTPVLNWTQNLQFKLDIRRDWADGLQFVDSGGHRLSYQNGYTLGIVAKF
ncbi:hypothetical protein EHO60_07665 [Leptospira fletcheri]|uniref:Porin n=1 Tax=Leptospira fletcheri TaxID=2484981 RepID=A0A4V3JDV0_9LEPT|nr:outer membrane beta-barrel protein [Leptospira fletcheri]TGK12135.1 hypothetical protein EHO60_07665 [Leptospira fletcheri]